MASSPMTGLDPRRCAMIGDRDDPTSLLSRHQTASISVICGRSQPRAPSNVRVGAPRPDASTTRSVSSVSERPEPLTNWMPDTPAPVAASAIPVTRLAGRSVMFATASTRRRSTSRISGGVAQSTEIRKSRFGTMPTSVRRARGFLFPGLPPPFPSRKRGVR
jgi:hypothetical protein